MFTLLKSMTLSLIYIYEYVIITYVKSTNAKRVFQKTIGNHEQHKFPRCQSGGRVNSMTSPLILPICSTWTSRWEEISSIFPQKKLNTGALIWYLQEFNARTVVAPHVNGWFHSRSTRDCRQRFLPLWSNIPYLRHQDLVQHSSPETANSI